MVDDETSMSIFKIAQHESNLAKVENHSSMSVLEDIFCKENIVSILDFSGQSVYVASTQFPTVA